MIKKLTKEDITKLNPCSVATDEFVSKYFNGAEYITFSDILLMDMKYEYKLWLVLSAGFISEEKVNQLRDRFVFMMGNSPFINLVRICSLVDSMGKVMRSINQDPELTYKQMLGAVIDIIMEQNIA
jgi:hypothetical protein